MGRHQRCWSLPHDRWRQTWVPRNDGLPKMMETGSDDPNAVYCIHKMVLDPKDSNTLYMQFHGGVLKSTDGADSWKKIESGMPSNFGFPMVITKSGNLFVVPLAKIIVPCRREIPCLPVLQWRQEVAAAEQGSADRSAICRCPARRDGGRSIRSAGVYLGTTMARCSIRPTREIPGPNCPVRFPASRPSRPV